MTWKKLIDNYVTMYDTVEWALCTKARSVVIDCPYKKYKGFNDCSDCNYIELYKDLKVIQKKIENIEVWKYGSI
jgi:predicted nucleic-acid-binding Zn-ribbon protein